jgi:hypothetical protein
VVSEVGGPVRKHESESHPDNTKHSAGFIRSAQKGVVVGWCVLLWAPWLTRAPWSARRHHGVFSFNCVVHCAVTLAMRLAAGASG